MRQLLRLTRVPVQTYQDRLVNSRCLYKTNLKVGPVCSVYIGSSPGQLTFYLKTTKLRLNWPCILTKSTYLGSQLALFVRGKTEGWDDCQCTLTKSAWSTRVVASGQLLTLIRLTVYYYPIRLVTRAVYTRQLLSLGRLSVYTYQVN